MLTYGGIVQSAEVPDRAGRTADVVLGFPGLEEDVARPEPFLGALVGRYAATPRSTGTWSRPAGGLAGVDGTRFDFRGPRAVGTGYDHDFVLDKGVTAATEEIAELRDPASGHVLTLSTTEPGVQPYTADHLTAPLTPNAGIALETQHFPDSPHHPAFPPPRNSARAGRSTRRRCTGSRRGRGTGAGTARGPGAARAPVRGSGIRAGAVRGRDRPRGRR